MEDVVKTAKLHRSFWQNKKVLLTGHTGFKGAWMALFLEKLGAKVIGIALSPEPRSLYNLLSPWKSLDSIYLDISQQENLLPKLSSMSVDIIIHMAAQAQVRDSYKEPIKTILTNTMGTAYLLQAAQYTQCKVILCITSDKVYRNEDDGKIFSETDSLGGDDPYSASKACAEIIINAWRKSFFQQQNAPILASARAGNVLGGGDWANDRLIPDIIRAVESKNTLSIRYPAARRSWQHVFDVITGYLLYIEALCQKTSIPLALNFGAADESEVVSVEDVVQYFQQYLHPTFNFEINLDNDAKEKNLLLLSAKNTKNILGWENRFDVYSALSKTLEWYQAFLAKKDMQLFSCQQLQEYFEYVSCH